MYIILLHGPGLLVSCVTDRDTYVIIRFSIVDLGFLGSGIVVLIYSSLTKIEFTAMFGYYHNFIMS